MSRDCVVILDDARSAAADAKQREIEGNIRKIREIRKAERVPAPTAPANPLSRPQR